jgi:hypothetical protein
VSPDYWIARRTQRPRLLIGTSLETLRLIAVIQILGGLGGQAFKVELEKIPPRGLSIVD